MKKGRLTLTVFAMIAMTDIFESIAQTLLKEGVNTIGITNIGILNLLEFLTKGAFNPIVWLGFLVYALNFILWMIILSRIDLSVALPVGGLGYIFVPLFSMIFLNETVNPVRWFGIIFIVTGVYLVSQSAGEKETVI
jgi:drug/metabolite transporter (DMT)-like permease